MQNGQKRPRISGVMVRSLSEQGREGVGGREEGQTDKRGRGNHAGCGGD